MRTARTLGFPLLLAVLLAPRPVAAAAPVRPHNVVLFVADGLRAHSVDSEVAPAMTALAREGVVFRNGHALFPTVTTANASAMATGHGIGDTGNFGNALYAGFPVKSAGGSVAPFVEDDRILGELGEHFGGSYLGVETIVARARKAGFATAAIGKLGPVLIFDLGARAGEATIVVDDATGTPSGVPLSSAVAARLRAAGLSLAAPGRGANGNPGNATTPGTTRANTAQQDWFVDVATRAVLPLLADGGRPFLLVFWSRDPDGTQHNQGDSLGRLAPGINGPTSRAAIRNADGDLASLRVALRRLGLDRTTDVVVTADHGFSTISKASATSAAAKGRYPGVPAGQLPPGFLAIDLARSLGLPLFDPDDGYEAIPEGARPKEGAGVLGRDPSRPDVVVAPNGGSDLIYLPRADAALARRIVAALVAQDYTAAIFVDERLGRYPGTLTLADAGLAGAAVTPVPAIAVSFASFDTVCGEPVRCAVEVADATLQQGQGYHGSFSRADTWPFMAAAGPDFKRGFVDDAPASNADVGRTIAHLLGIAGEDRGAVEGRVLTEALAGGALPAVASGTCCSPPAGPDGLRTCLAYQRVGAERYVDAAGDPRRTVGLSAREGVEACGAAAAR